MKRLLLLLTACASLLVSACGTLNSTRLLQGGLLAAQALAITDDQVRACVHESVLRMDEENPVAAENSELARRLKRITAGLTDVDGVPLNFKVYQTPQINAFACADGSVRVFSGLMQVMNDDELLSVLGHEIGHVALKHSKRQMQNTLLRNAALEGLASTDQRVAALTDSQLAAIGAAILDAKYSKSQETEADDYGYDFLVAQGKNPWVMAQAFQKLLLYANNEAPKGTIGNLFSSHPDTESRISRVAEKAAADGFKIP